MKRVLIVAYYFPPRGGGGTQRFAKFCKYLPEFGIAPIVLTSGAIAIDRNAPHDDPSLHVDENENVIVERVDAPVRGSVRRRLLRKLRFFLDEDEWADAAAERAIELARQHSPEAIITTLSPFACYRIGLRIQRELGLPWVVDLRDPWSLDGWRRYRSGLHARFDLRHMQKALTRADCVIANVPEAKKEFVTMGAAAERTVVIPNGYDEPDFALARPDEQPEDDRFTLVHVGTLHGVDAPEGLTSNTPLLRRHRQIAPLGRTGYYLLHAVRQLQDRSPELHARLRVHLYGHADTSHRDLVDRLGLQGCVTLHGYVPHARTIAALRAADAAFVPLHDVPAGERALVVPGKLYEALASERAVLAALPPGDGADLVQALAAGVVVPPTDAAALSHAIEEMLRAHGDGKPLAGCARGRLTAFTRRNLTSQLARVLEAAVRRDSVIEITDPWRRLADQESA